MQGDKETVMAMTSMGIAGLIGRVVSLIFLFFVARIVTVEDYGLFRTIVAVGSLAALFATSGPTMYVARTISRRIEEREEVKEIVTTGFVILITFFVISVISLVLLNQFSSEVLFVLIGVIIFDYASSILRGLNFFNMTALFHLLTGFLKLALIIFLGFMLNITLDVTVVILIFSFSVAPSLAIVLLIVRRFPLLNMWRTSFERMKEGMRFCIPAMSMAVAHYSMVSIALPFTYSEYGDALAGYMSVAFTFGAVFTLIPSGINFVLMPVVARASTRSQVVRKLKIFVSLTFLLSSMLFIGIMLFSSDAITLLFGEDYLPAQQFMLAILTGFFLMAISTVFDAIWVGVGILKIPLLVAIVGAMINLTWIWISISDGMGPMAIADAFLFSQIAGFSLMIIITFLNSHKLVPR